MELKDKLKGKLKEIEVLTEETKKLLEELTDEPEEEKKDKIELLDEYMKRFDERLFVECTGSTVDLVLRDAKNDSLTIAWIWIGTGMMCGKDFEKYPYLFNQLLKYKYLFKEMYDELFKEEE